MSMLEPFYPGLTESIADRAESSEPRAPQWKLNGHRCWRRTFFGGFVRRVEEQRVWPDNEGERIVEKRWRDMRDGDLLDVEEIRTERELKRLVSDLRRDEPPIPDVFGSAALAEEVERANASQSRIEKLTITGEVPEDRRAAA